MKQSLSCSIEGHDVRLDRLRQRRDVLFDLATFACSVGARVAGVLRH
jgi:hypothetical protein